MYLSEQVSLFNSPYVKEAFDVSGSQPVLKDEYQSVLMQDGAMVGEIAALGRMQRTARAYAETIVTVREIRWQGLRDLRKFSPDWREMIDKNYREKMLKAQLAAHPDFSGLGKDILDKIAQATLFEHYGGYEWTSSYRKEYAQDSCIIVSV
jgi:CRP-like cAMP-binding protein